MLIAGHLGHTDTLNLARCCHQFYNSLILQVYNSTQFEEHCLWAFSRLVHILIQHPQRAVAVFNLSLGSWNRFCLRHHDKGVKFDRNIILPVLQTVCHSKEEQEDWETDLQEGGAEDPWLALLMPLLPHLDQLNMMFEYPSAHMHKMLERAVRNFNPFDANQAFTSLREVSVTWWDTESGVNSSDVLPFFRFPAMRTFRGHMTVDAHPDGNREGMDDGLPSSDFSKITTIDLRSSNSGRGFPDLLCACENLESFSYLHADGGVGSDGFNPLAFYHSLYHHKNTLRKLKILFDIDKGYYPLGSSTEDVFVGSLAAFSDLKEICLRASNVLDFDEEQSGLIRTPLIKVFPMSLESLSLEDVDKKDLKVLISQLEEVVRNAKSYFPHLSKLAIEGNLHESEEFDFTAWLSQTLPRNTRRGPLVIKPEFVGMTQNLRTLCHDMDINFCLWDRQCK